MKASALRGLTLLLTVLLVVVPSGNSVCWPLPNGRHLHIGWSEPNGQEALGLTVFSHKGGEHVKSSLPPAFTTAPSVEAAAQGDVPLVPQSLTLLLPPITLCWLLLLMQRLTQPQPAPAPLDPPPRIQLSF